jgi:hypothetical protein
MRYRIKEVIRRQKKSSLQAVAEQFGPLFGNSNLLSYPSIGFVRIRHLQIASDNPPYRNQFGHTRVGAQCGLLLFEIESVH